MDLQGITHRASTACDPQEFHPAQSARRFFGHYAVFFEDILMELMKEREYE